MSNMFLVGLVLLYYYLKSHSFILFIEMLPSFIQKVEVVAGSL